VTHPQPCSGGADGRCAEGRFTDRLSNERQPSRPPENSPDCQEMEMSRIFASWNRMALASAEWRGYETQRKR